MRRPARRPGRPRPEPRARLRAPRRPRPPPPRQPLAEPPARPLPPGRPPARPPLARPRLPPGRGGEARPPPRLPRARDLPGAAAAARQDRPRGGGRRGRAPRRGGSPSTDGGLRGPASPRSTRPGGRSRTSPPAACACGRARSFSSRPSTPLLRQPLLRTGLRGRRRRDDRPAPHLGPPRRPASASDASAPGLLTPIPPMPPDLKIYRLPAPRQPPPPHRGAPCRLRPRRPRRALGRHPAFARAGASPARSGGPGSCARLPGRESLRPGRRLGARLAFLLVRSRQARPVALLPVPLLTPSLSPPSSRSILPSPSSAGSRAGGDRRPQASLASAWRPSRSRPAPPRLHRLAAVLLLRHHTPIGDLHGSSHWATPAEMRATGLLDHEP